jgi:hypothetical protein
MAGDVLAFGVVLLLVANNRNAWDLTLVMARRQSAGNNYSKPPECTGACVTSIPSARAARR